MKEAVIRPGLKAEVVDTSPIPTPGPFEVIIKVVVAATNPIDWKSTSREEEIAIHGELEVTGYNSTGKDVAGFVYAVGKFSCSFHILERSKGRSLIVFQAPKQQNSRLATGLALPTTARAILNIPLALLAPPTEFPIPSPLKVNKPSSFHLLPS